MFVATDLQQGGELAGGGGSCRGTAHQFCHLFSNYAASQIGTQNSLELLEDPKAEVVDEIAAKLGLRKV